MKVTHSTFTHRWLAKSRPMPNHEGTKTSIFKKREEADKNRYRLFTYLFLGRGEGREEERERNIDVREKHPLVASPKHPDRGPNQQHWHVFWSGTKPATFCVVEQCPTNWATLARTEPDIFEKEVEYSVLGGNVKYFIIKQFAFYIYMQRILHIVVFVNAGFQRDWTNFYFYLQNVRILVDP